MGEPYAVAVCKAGEESPMHLICLTNTMGTATCPLALACLASAGLSKRDAHMPSVGMKAVQVTLGQ